MTEEDEEREEGWRLVRNEGGVRAMYQLELHERDKKASEVKRREGRKTK